MILCMTMLIWPRRLPFVCVTSLLISLCENPLVIRDHPQSQRYADDFRDLDPQTPLPKCRHWSLYALEGLATVTPEWKSFRVYRICARINQKAEILRLTRSKMFLVKHCLLAFMKTTFIQLLCRSTLLSHNVCKSLNNLSSSRIGIPLSATTGISGFIFRDWSTASGKSCVSRYPRRW